MESLQLWHFILYVVEVHFLPVPVEAVLPEESLEDITILCSSPHFDVLYFLCTSRVCWICLKLLAKWDTEILFLDMLENKTEHWAACTEVCSLVIFEPQFYLNIYVNVVYPRHSKCGWSCFHFLYFFSWMSTICI